MKVDCFAFSAKQVGLRFWEDKALAALSLKNIFIVLLIYFPYGFHQGHHKTYYRQHFKWHMYRVKINRLCLICTSINEATAKLAGYQMMWLKVSPGSWKWGIPNRKPEWHFIWRLNRESKWREAQMSHKGTSQSNKHLNRINTQKIFKPEF